MVDVSSGNQGIDIPDLATTLGTRKVSIVMFDACLMNMVEVADELKDGAQYVIGSESVTYAGSWPYSDIGRAIGQGGNPLQSDKYPKAYPSLIYPKGRR